MEVHLIGSQQAKGLIDESITGADDGLHADVLKVIRVFHDRHIGIPAAFAHGIASGFAMGTPHDLSSPVRQTIYLRLLEALDATNAMKQDPRQFDILPRHFLFDFCLLPLCARLVEQLGETYLFSLDPSLDDVSPDAYASYAERFDQAFWAFCDSVGSGVNETHRKTQYQTSPQSKDLFWERSAHQLWSEVQRLRHRGHARSEMDFSRVLFDDMALRMIHGLDPSPKIEMDANRKSFELTEEQNPLFSHPKQGGVYGIHSTTRLDDVEDMLISELMLPPVLLADKLLNSSFFAKHRPPPLDERRQLMFLGACLDDGDDAPLALVRSSWMDAAFRLAIALYKNELFASELRFGQWRKMVGLAKSSFQVGTYPHLGSLDPVRATRSQMRRFFCDAGWLPGFLDLMPTLSKQHIASASKGRSLPQDERLQTILDALFPEADEPLQEGQREFEAALLLVIRKNSFEPEPVELVGREWTVPIYTCTVDCPHALVGGEAYVFDDGVRERFAIPILGEAGKPATMEALTRTSAELIEHILGFYWERGNG